MTKEVKQDEPMAYLSNHRQRLNITINPVVIKSMPIAVEWEMPLYAKPQTKEWVGLTKKEYDDIYASNKDNLYDAMMVVATYLKRKNT